MTDGGPEVEASGFLTTSYGWFLFWGN